MKISVIIPTYREPDVFGAVRRVRDGFDEILVVDGESPDDTAERARAAGARVVVTTKGRGGQLAAGADAATGDVLFFVHADVVVPAGARAAITTALSDPEVGGGNFHLRFSGETLAARIFTHANDLRRRTLSMYYGDSGLFLRRSVYQAIGGFRPLPIFEDHELVRRLERAAKTVYLSDHSVVASARRFEARPLRTLALWTGLQLAYTCGVSAERLARFYADQRP